MVKGLTTKEIGDALERRVAIHYEALGYQVTPDVLLGGHQIDLLARRHVPGAGTITIAVEVKSRSGVLGVNDVTRFALTAQRLIADMMINTAVLVTDAQISPKAKEEVARSDAIRLVRITDLEREIFNNAESFMRVVRDYELDTKAALYYPLQGTTGETKIHDVADYLDTWSMRSNGVLLLIGDFGSGKTTLLQRAFYTAAKRRLEQSDALFPVFLRLRMLRQFSDLWSFIHSAIMEVQYISFPKILFDAELKAGRLCLFLDGFDEVYTGATTRDRAAYLDFLRPLLLSPSPVILSSRPTFFNSIEEVIRISSDLGGHYAELSRLPSAGLDHSRLLSLLNSDYVREVKRDDFGLVVSISQLDADSVRRAISRFEPGIEKNLGITTDEFTRALYEIYDLEDLMKRPLLLDMILVTTVSGEIALAGSTPVGPATLYELYTQQAARRDKQTKGPVGQMLGPELRLKASRLMAQAMLKKGEVILTKLEMENCVRALLSEETLLDRRHEMNIEGAVTDIRTCSFVRFLDDGSVSFAHKSFAEFFVAQLIFLAAKNGDLGEIEAVARQANKEVVYFLSSYARDHPDFAAFIAHTLRTERPRPISRILHRVAFASAKLAGEYHFRNVHIGDVELNKAIVTGLHLEDASLQQFAIRRVDGRGWFVRSSRLTRGEIVQTNFQEGRFQGAFTDMVLDDVRFEQCTVDLECRSVALSQTRFGDSVISLTGDLHMLGVEFADCSLRLSDAAAEISGAKICFAKSRVESSRLRRWHGEETEVSFSGCTLLGLLFDGRLDNGGRDYRMKLRGCSGVIVVDTDRCPGPSEPLQRLRDHNPELIVVERSVLRDAGEIHEFQFGRREADRPEQGKSPRIAIRDNAKNPRLNALFERSAAAIERHQRDIVPSLTGLQWKDLPVEIGEMLRVEIPPEDVGRAKDRN